MRMKNQKALTINRQLPSEARSKITLRMAQIGSNIKKIGLMAINHFEQLFERPLEGPPRPMYYLPKSELGLLNKSPGLKGKKKEEERKEKENKIGISIVYFLN